MRMPSSKQFVSTLVVSLVGSALAVTAMQAGASAEAATAAKSGKAPTAVGPGTYRCGFYKQDCIDVRNAMADSNYTVGPIIYSPVSGYSFDYWP
ncbi:hypothetical protein ACQP2T_51490 [Nonomuraea sp. CA-143628]|uniref:hypothetical protein n=1 Tax=Nonomuraea sp. CA-143628 TaxID=3239997 RepID=UPI003D8EA902